MKRTYLLIAIILLTTFTTSLLAKKGAPPSLPKETNLVARLMQYGSQDVDEAMHLVASTSLETLANQIKTFNEYPIPDTIGGLVKIVHKISDTLVAPAFLFVPEGYNPQKPTPLLVILHGGVSGSEFRDMGGYDWRKDERITLFNEKGWLALFPMGKVGCLWWDPVGMANIDWLVREVKSHYNVDDDRVVMGGFSDGASGSFHFGMLNPTDYAFFTPRSGHLAVGSLAGPSQDYVPNLVNRPAYVTVGGRDQLYPTKRMMPLLKLALDACAPMWITSYDTASHNDGYMVFEYPLLVERVENRPREPFPMRLYWELDDLRFNRIDWLEITSLDTTLPPAEWHKDYNLKLIDDRITIGFIHNPEYEGEGVYINSITEDTLLPAVKAGLKPGDILVALDTLDITDIASLNNAKMTKKRGDKVSLTIIRDGQRMTFETEFPPVKEYDAFKRQRKSAALKAQRLGNIFIVETSRIGSFTIYINPQMVRMDQPIIVQVDGKVLFEGLVEPDQRVLVSQFLKDKDRKRLWWGKIDVVVR